MSLRSRLAALAADDAAAALPAESDDVLDRTTAIAWSWRLAWFGVALRVLRYLCCFPLWADEQCVVVNLLDRDYAGLFDALDQRQVAPVGFLLLVKWLVETLGMHEYVLRLPAVVCGSAGLLVFRALAERLLGGTALAAAVGVMAVAFFPIRHAAELKPYACDLLFASWLASSFLDWRREPSNRRLLRRLLVPTLSAPWFSFPAMFLLAGFGAAMLPAVVRCRERAARLNFVMYATASLVAAVVSFQTSIRPQSAAADTADTMQRYWADEFPPSWTEPLRWPGWLWEAHTGEGLAYPIGSKHSGSLVSAALIFLGARRLWRRGRSWMPLVALATCGLALAAACGHHYPYGNGERVQQYWAPLLCTFFGVGVAAVVGRFAAVETRRRAVRGLVGCFAVLGVVWILEAEVRGYKHRWDIEHQRFARWFWQLGSAGAPQLCLDDDLGWRLYDRFEQRAYRAYRAVARRERPSVATPPAALPVGKPIECVTFACNDQPRDDDEYRRWLATMSRHYRLVEERTYPVLLNAQPGCPATYYVWRFEPKSPEASPLAVVKPPATIVADRRR